MIAPGTVENGVLAGRGGFLFLAGGSHKVFDIVTGKIEVPGQALEVFAANLRSRAAWAAARGVAYAHVIMPDKQSIVPELWPLERPPVKTGEVFAHANSEMAGSLIYPADVLAAEWRLAVSRVDTHLRDYGSVLVAAMLAEKFSGGDQSAVVARLLASIVKREKAEAGDLGGKLAPAVTDFAEMVTLAEPGPFFSNRIEGGNNGLVDLRFNPAAPDRRRVVLFGDSFGRQLVRFLQYWYAEVYFFRTGHFHAEIADLCQPDIVITENVERYLDSPALDEDRPHFLLYPYLNDKPYAPAKAFAEALSAVLSFPRPPYVNFLRGLTAEVKPAPAPERLLRYDGLRLTDAGPAQGLLKVLEEPAVVPQRRPALVADFSGRGLAPKLHEQQQIHGSYLVQRENALLFGANHLLTPDGAWSCEARVFKGQFLEMLKWAAYEANFPGPKPLVEAHVMRTAQLPDEAVERIDEPVFLATPLEPDNWGRWLATVAPKAVQYQRYGMGRKFFCRVQQPWQRAFLNLFGVTDAMILPHDPGRAYICRDVMTVEYSVVNMTISADERMMFFETVAKHRGRGEGPGKLFVSRLSRSRKAPGYRVLQNEAEFAALLEGQGFAMVEPETLSLAAQISLFSGAQQIVALGGAAIYNAVFCAPETSFITVESSDFFVNPHSQLLSSLDLRYGVIFGSQDPDDASPVHKRWSLDVAPAAAAVAAFME